MAILLKKPIHVQLICDVLNLPAVCSEISIDNVAAFSEQSIHSLSFSNKIQTIDQKMVVIGPPEWKSENGVILSVMNPRLAFIYVMQALDQHVGFVHDDAPPKIDPSVVMGYNVVIENGVEIGAGTVLYNNIVIGRGTKIGQHCLIKSGAVIGEEGFGFERDPAGVPQRMPHLGKVIIGHHVEVGSLVTICRGALSNTIIEDHVKIDDHCHIAHNCHIKKSTMLAAGAILSGSVTVGEESWVSPNSTIMNKSVIGHHALIGIGAVVVRDVPDHAKVMGNPAKTIPLQNS
jgi:acyl-[acyl carrier protein]--UDP-N-acetylglucosamine O-acyltransferase